MTGLLNYSSAANPTTLSTSLGSVTPGTTGSIQVASITGMPTQFPFTLIIEWNTSNAEVVTVTQAATGTGPFTFANCVRGDDGSGAPAHNPGVSVTHGVSARDFTRTAYIIPPSGDPTGAADATAINNAFTAGHQTVQLLPGIYNINAMITIPTGCALIGAWPTNVNGASGFPAGLMTEQGSVIQTAGAFSTGVPSFPAAVIQCSNTTATQQGAQVIQNISINASSCPAASGVIGIQLHGAVGGGIIKDCVVFRPDGPCLTAEVDGVTTFWPIQWTITGCEFSASRSSHGVQIGKMTDSNFVACYSHDNTLDGWNVGSPANTIWTGCRGETNHQNGWHFTGFVAGAEGALLNGCVSQLNQQSGFLFDASGAALLGTYQLTGCMAITDGQAAAGILAGFYDKACASRVMLTGCTTLANVTGPAYGAYEGSIAFGMGLVGCQMHGLTAATFDDGTNTHALSNLVPLPF